MSPRVHSWTYFIRDRLVAPIGLLIITNGISFHKYAEDTHYTAIVKPPGNDLRYFEFYRAGLHHWFWATNLLLNPDRSEVCFVGMRQKLSRTPLPLSVADCPTTVSDKLQILRVTLDAAFTFKDYVNDITKAYSFRTWDLRHIRALSRDVVKAVCWHLFELLHRITIWRYPEVAQQFAESMTSWHESFAM